MRHFVARGQSVIAVIGPSLEEWRLAGVKGVKIIRLDLENRLRVSHTLSESMPDVIINCAAYGAYPSQTDADRIYRVNLEVVRTLLDYARQRPGFRAFVQAGSSSEYGLNCEAPSEADATVPDSHYAVSKVAATSLVQYYGKKLGVPAWSLRLYSVYGRFEDSSRLVPNLLSCARKGKLPPLVSPDITRDFIHVDDVCSAFEQVVASAGTLPFGEVYNIGSGKCTTVQEMVSLVRSLFHVVEEPSWGSMDNRSWDNCNWYANPRKASEVLGWKAKVSLEEGLGTTLRWMEENEALVKVSLLQTVAGRK